MLTTGGSVCKVQFGYQTTTMTDLFPAGASAVDTEDEGTLVDLNSKIESSECYGRNEAAGFPMTNLFIGDSRLGCKSDADEQLIIHVAFKEFVKVCTWTDAISSYGPPSGTSSTFVAHEVSSSPQIRSIKLTEYNNGMDPECNPSKIHIFVNRTNIGFEDWEDVDPTQTLHLTTEQLKESADPISLKYVKYQRVKNLTFFIEDNQGGEVSALGGMKLFGKPVQTPKMSDFNKSKEGM